MTVKEPGKLIARIDYPGSNGLVGDWVEYRDEAKFLADLKKENYYGVPLCVVLYRDRDGKTISKDFLQEMDPPPNGFSIRRCSTPATLRECRSCLRCRKATSPPMS